MTVATQIQDAKESLNIFLSAYFDGWNHTVSGVEVEFPDCYIKMVYTDLPEGPAKSFDKPLITLLLAPGAVERGQWVTDTDSGSSAIFVTWEKHTTAVGYYVYRSLTEVGGYAKVSDLLTGLSYVDTPSAGDYWYQIKSVDDEDAESDWGVPVEYTSSAIVYPKMTKSSGLMFHVFVAVAKAQGGQRVVDTVCSLLTALLNSHQSIYLKNAGLRFPAITPPVSLQPEHDIWVSSMFLSFRTDTEYS
jgi:hypothetical protein